MLKAVTIQFCTRSSTSIMLTGLQFKHTLQQVTPSPTDPQNQISLHTVPDDSLNDRSPNTKQLSLRIIKLAARRVYFSHAQLSIITLDFPPREYKVVQFPRVNRSRSEQLLRTWTPCTSSAPCFPPTGLASCASVTEQTMTIINNI